MSRPALIIRTKAKLLRPAKNGKGKSWTFLVLPKSASAKLPTRSRTTVDGTLNRHAFRAVLDPDGKGSHWLKVSSRMRTAAAAQVGDIVNVEIAPSTEELETRVPADLWKALNAAPAARVLWSAITPIARRDWIHWITSAKRPETRARRVERAGDMLAAGNRRVCCFDRSGMYSNSFAAPEAAADDPG